MDYIKKYQSGNYIRPAFMDSGPTKAKANSPDVVKDRELIKKQKIATNRVSNPILNIVDSNKRFNDSLPFGLRETANVITSPLRFGANLGPVVTGKKGKYGNYNNWGEDLSNVAAATMLGMSPGNIGVNLLDDMTMGIKDLPDAVKSIYRGVTNMPNFVNKANIKRAFNGLNKADADLVKLHDNQLAIEAPNLTPNSAPDLQPPPNVIDFDLPSINLERRRPKSKKKLPSYGEEDLGGGLVLVNNPSRLVDQSKALGKKVSLKKIRNEGTNEYAALKSWKDKKDNLFYNFSADMPSSPLKAGKAFKVLEEHIPVGGVLKESESLSMSSLDNMIKQYNRNLNKINPKYEHFVDGHIPLTNVSPKKKVPFSELAESTTRDLVFKNYDDAVKSSNAINKMLNKQGLPDSKIAERGWSYGIDVPNIAMKKLYGILGLTYGSGMAKNYLDD